MRCSRNFGSNRLPEGKGLLEDLGIRGRIILNCISRKSGDRMLAGFVLLRTGTGGGRFDHGHGYFNSKR
jgi:hypothetical protein